LFATKSRTDSDRDRKDGSSEPDKPKKKKKDREKDKEKDSASAPTAGSISPQGGEESAKPRRNDREDKAQLEKASGKDGKSSGKHAKDGGEVEPVFDENGLVRKDTHERAIEAAQNLVNELQIAHLGFFYTQQLLCDLELDPRTHNRMISEADCANATRWTSQEPEDSDSDNESREKPKTRPPVSQKNVVCFINAQLRLQGPDGLVEIEKPTSRVAFGEWGALTKWQRLAQKILVPVFAQHARHGHAERVALVALLAEVLEQTSPAPQRPPKDWPNWAIRVNGDVYVHISHFPCISCVAVFCSFMRVLPRVRLHVSFENAWDPGDSPLS
jgi:hypothetical protein